MTKMLSGNELNLALGEALTHLRASRSQRQVAELAGVPPANLSKYEHGRSGMTVDVLFRLLHAMGADIGDLAVVMGYAPSDEDLALTIREIRDAVEKMARRQHAESIAE